MGKDISIIDFINESDFLDAEGPSMLQPSEGTPDQKTRDDKIPVIQWDQSEIKVK